MIGDLNATWWCDSAHPARAEAAFRRWLAASSNPELYREQLESLPVVAIALGKLFGASPSMVDLVVQNSDLPTYLFENGLGTLPTKDAVIELGKLLLRSSISTTHSFDRLRYLRQRCMFHIALADINSHAKQPEIWAALSELADGIVVLAHELVWTNHCAMRQLDSQPCPVGIVAYGKHAGREVNYSSDLDLVFILQDGVTESLRKEAVLFCEAFVRAMETRMGRGGLYRIDLRLRPYGAAGELVNSVKATKAYYQRHAEPWEVQALLRSRWIVGFGGDFWEAMRAEHCFRGHLSELSVVSTLEMRARIDASATEGDFKRGPGGIRDLEFILQLVQLANGHRDPRLQTTGSMELVEALRTLSLEGLGIFPVNRLAEIEVAYTFLRQLEHRCQLRYDQQTHEIPASEEDSEVIALSLNYPGAEALKAKLNAVRTEVRTWYEEWSFSSTPGTSMTAPNAEVDALVQSFSAQQDDALRSTLRSNPDSCRRLGHILQSGPLLVPAFRRDWTLMETLLSGEIEDEAVPHAHHPIHAHSERAKIWARWLMGSIDDPWSDWSDWVSQTIRKWFDSRVSIIALGSLGSHKMSPLSDGDLVFLCTAASDQSALESIISRQLAEWKQTQTTALNPVGLDLRLRADGGKGMIVRTLGAFTSYALNDMDPWERVMLGFGRSLDFRSNSSPDSVVNLVPLFARAWTLDDSEQMRAMRQRILSERTAGKADIKLVAGGLLDIEWIIRARELMDQRYDESTMEMRLFGTELDAAYNFLIRLRAVLQLKVFEDQLPPDASARHRIASVMGLSSADELVNRISEIQTQVLSKVAW